MSNQQKNIPIKEWAVDDRPREKALAKGLAALSNAELIAIIFANGTKDKSALDLAQDILHACNNNLHQLNALSVEQISKLAKGIGKVKALNLHVALELGRRKQIEAASEKLELKSPRHFFEFFQPMIGHMPIENFCIAYLNTAYKLLGHEILHVGNERHASIDIKRIARKVIDNNAANVVIAHNHPSGTLRPSEPDIKLTHKIKVALSMIDVLLTDHLIITHNGYYSFADNDLL